MRRLSGLVLTKSSVCVCVCVCLLCTCISDSSQNKIVVDLSHLCLSSWHILTASATEPYCQTVSRQNLAVVFTSRDLLLKQSSAFSDAEGTPGGPTALELMEQLDVADLTNSCTTTPSISPSPSLLATNGTPQSARRAGIAPVQSVSASSCVSTPERLRRMTKF